MLGFDEANLSHLQALADGKLLATEAQMQLATWELSNPQRAEAFGLTAENVMEQVKLRSQHFAPCHARIQSNWQQHHVPASIDGEQPQRLLALLWILWLPLALHLVAQRQALARPFVQGILGIQGTGKTTLAAILGDLLDYLGYSSLALSLDDLYKPYAERLQLQQQDPRLQWRGPPGTHDISLGIDVLAQLRQPDPTLSVAIPRFDKSAYSGAGERTEPELTTPKDIILFEGWFVGVRPIDPAAFSNAPLPITNDADRQFARDMNVQLTAYLPLWEQLDRLLVLYPSDYQLSKQWRRQAEQQRRAAGKGGMSDAEVDCFVEYFWRALHPELFVRSQLQDGRWFDLAIELDETHAPLSIYRSPR